MDETCQSCRYADFTTRFMSEGRLYVGSCKRYPPASSQGDYPKIKPDDWCGEWKGKHILLTEGEA